MKTEYVKQMPEPVPGMVTVSKETFYSAIGPLNVHPRIIGGYDRIFGYRSDWMLRNDSLIGVTVGGTCFSHTRYMLTPQFIERHQIAIDKAA
jgi:hypothetical protein